MPVGTHYSHAFDPDFNAKVRDAAKQLVQQFNEVGKGYPVLCYTGFSGISLATLLAQHIRMLDMRVEHIYIRKPGEKSHGSDIEYSCANLGEQAVPIFVDDFICYGETHERVRQTLIKFDLEKSNQPIVSYDDWYGFLFLHDLKPVTIVDGTIYNRMPYVQVGLSTVDVDIYSELWEEMVPHPDTYSLTEDAA